jgi:hypothetical protein
MILPYELFCGIIYVADFAYISNFSHPDNLHYNREVAMARTMDKSASSDAQDTTKPMGPWSKALGYSLTSLILSFVIIPAALFGWRRLFFNDYSFFNGYGRQHSFAFNYWERNWMTYSHLFLAMFCMMIFIIAALASRYATYDRTLGAGRAAIMNFAVFSTLLGLWVPSIWNTGKQRADYVLKDSATFVLPTLEQGATPFSMEKLVLGGTVNTDGTAMVTGHDVRTTIVKGDVTDFLNRTDGIYAALRVMRADAPGGSATIIRDETLAFIATPQDGQSQADSATAAGYFSVIRDGSDRQNRPYGIITWSGSGSARSESCVFDKDHDLNRALVGRRGNSLENLMLEDHPEFRWDINDAYGYCEVMPNGAPKAPRIVVPVTREQRIGFKTVRVPAGILLIKGSPTGDPIITYMSEVKDGDIPGPVYPESMAKSQRQKLDWAAGRKFHNNNWGFDEPDLVSNTENNSEFVQVDPVTQKVIFTTPVATKAPGSSAVSAYVVVEAGHVSSGTFNKMNIYVLDDRDGQLPSLARYEGFALASVNDRQPGFFTSGGSLIEFTPGRNGTWTAFAVDKSGVLWYVVTIDPKNNNQVTVRSAISVINSANDDGLLLSEATPRQLAEMLNDYFQSGSADSTIGTPADNDATATTTQD